MMDDFEAEIKTDFLNEAKDLLQVAENDFLELEQNPQNKTLIDAIFRFAHNLKGTSRAVGLGEIAELTHRAENLLLEIKQDKIHATPKIVSILLAFNDKVREMVEGLSRDLEMSFDCSELIRELEEASSSKKVEAEIEVVTTEEVVPEKIVEEVVEKKDFIEELPHVLPDVRPVAKKEPRKDDETIRVSLNRLERLNDLVGELVILRGQAESSLRKYGENKTAHSLEKLCKDIQDLSMSLRMVSVGPTFQKLSRVVRDTSKDLGKKIELRIIGEDTEIDKTVVENLSDPLVHIIRNSIDHGVEVKEERIKAGKPETGTVEVMAFHEGNFLVIQITDDGKGIDPELLRTKAIAKGILSPDANLTEQQIINLIFHPGFSSRDEVSEISGRGVGMDVVKTNIESLGGEVLVHSKLGVGSCFRLMLPLTLAIIEGMLIEVGNQQYIIPKSQVQEVVRLDQTQVTSVTGQKPYLNLRGEVIPLFSLAQELGTASEEAQIVLIVRNGVNAFAVGINDVIRLQQVVVKPVTREMGLSRGFMGVTILGDGRTSLIIDLIGTYMHKNKKDMTQKRDVKMREAA